MSDDIRTEIVPGHGGAGIAVHRLGAGRPVILLHGLASNAETNWIRYGSAATLAAAGFEAIMLDLRAHGRSAAPHDPAAYPRDVAVLDVEAVLAALDIGADAPGGIDLVGYSLGSRISAMLVARGLAPRRLVLGGMGLEGLTRWAERRDHFLAMLARFDIARLGDEDFLAIQFMKQMNADPVALRLLLLSMGDMPREALADVTAPALVLCGDRDRDNGSAQALAEALPDARLKIVPGTHMNAITRPDLGAAIAAYLAA